MVSRITSGAVCGMESFLVQVEVDVSNGLPGLELVGLLSSEVREAKERVRVALKNAGVRLPPSRITVSLSPADRRKQGSAFDLPIAAGILESLGVVCMDRLSDCLIAGELGLDGRVCPVRGILPMLLEAKRQGKKRCIVPLQNAAEAQMAGEIEVFAVRSLGEFILLLQGKTGQKPEQISDDKNQKTGQIGGRENQRTDRETVQVKNLEEDNIPDFRELGGALRVRRAAEIAAAGFHHLLLLGPPGSGKTMAARCMAGILPPLTREESLEVSTIYSIAGIWNGENGKLVEKRPFVSPHHTVTPQALAGGGNIPRPGAISLAHHGVLFLDEMTELKRTTLDLLRQPLEEHKICIARSSGSYEYPANFMLVAAANPCPCGYYPDMRRCHCSEREVRRYLGRISGPVFDRIDLCVETRRVEFADLGDTGITAGEDSETVRKRVMGARKIQQRRFAGSKTRYNGQMNLLEQKQYCRLEGEEQEFMQQVFEQLMLSARGYHKLLKVARTIADLEGSQQIRKCHLSEAISFRSDLQGL